MKMVYTGRGIYQYIPVYTLPYFHLPGIWAWPAMAGYPAVLYCSQAVVADAGRAAACMRRAGNAY